MVRCRLASLFPALDSARMRQSRASTKRMRHCSATTVTCTTRAIPIHPIGPATRSVSPRCGSPSMGRTLMASSASILCSCSTCWALSVMSRCPMVRSSTVPTRRRFSCTMCIGTIRSKNRTASLRLLPAPPSTRFSVASVTSTLRSLSVHSSAVPKRAV